MMLIVLVLVVILTRSLTNGQIGLMVQASSAPTSSYFEYLYLLLLISGHVVVDDSG